MKRMFTCSTCDKLFPETQQTFRPWNEREEMEIAVCDKCDDLLSYCNQNVEVTAEQLQAVLAAIVSIGDE